MSGVYDVVIIGAGQAGIAMSQQLQERGRNNHLMLEAGKRIGDSWRSRYESLVLFTPKSYSSLPGLQMKGDPRAYPTKDEMADYLEEYVSHFDLPFQLDSAVTGIEKKQSLFHVHTSTETIQSKKVVVASGAFQQPYIPPIIQHADAVSHIHSSQYTEPSALMDGPVLVVGGGSSGAQIAVELAADRDVTLATSTRPAFLPLEVFGKSIFYWLETFGLLYASTDTRRGKFLQKRRDPIFGKELKQAMDGGKVNMKPRVSEVNGKQAVFSDGSTVHVSHIIWATGFVPSYDIVHIEGALDKNGKPLHHRGVSPIEGLFYIGLPWQHHRGSALVCGVGKDAEYLAERI
ncbi:flavin-containing monooxygenase [Bacillus piscicola]|uniref:flavin-containing monooxygenase n=1 Tax=Bacillus piscicola TaxID=1632684 RepID=UPI001F096D82|nr:NAD(P)/FAD-dependent oxidoreductase [Bacillus piscicola]